MISPLSSYAGQVTSRSLQLGTSQAGVITTHKFNFTVPTSGNVGSIKFEYCDTAYAACVTPGGLVTTAATLAVQDPAENGFSMVNTANGAPYITRTTDNIAATTAVTYTLGNITNPTTPNAEYWVRITTYASTNTTGGSTDDGVVVLATAEQITVTGVMPESLVFCVGTTGTDCGNIGGPTTVSLGTFSPTTTRVGQSLMSASTNAGFGYVITVNGTTLSSGANTIAAMGTQSANSTGCAVSCASATGTSQFGTNVRANNIVSAGGNFGADVTPTGAGYNGAGAGGYNTTNTFRFFSGDTVASSSGVTRGQLYTNSYLVNVGGDQAAGSYSATLTYICTATF